MPQTALFEEVIDLITPNPTPSADSPGIGHALSGQPYVLKQATPAIPYLPASEWICTQLALLLHLPAPIPTPCRWHATDELLFGSRLEGSVSPGLVYPLPSLPAPMQAVMSRTWVLDMLLANEDRHPGNWLVTQTGPSLLLRPIDFSRALLLRYPPLPHPVFTSGNSFTFYALAKSTGVLNTSMAEMTLQHLRDMPKADWTGAVDSTPEEWLPLHLRRELKNWWWSPMWFNRLKQMEQHL